jgi:S-(hydroxymethyl)mycothiol dehydrogenase
VTVGVLLNAPGEDARIEELELDGPGPGEVQVRLEATGVCHSDLFVKKSGGWGMPYPILLGHEGAGVVEEIGEGVDRPSVGDRVVLAWRAPCGKCAPCLRGDPRRCRTPLRARRRLRRKSDGAVVTQTLLCGTFATRTIVHAGAAIPVPPELPAEQACLRCCDRSRRGSSDVPRLARQHGRRDWLRRRRAVGGAGCASGRRRPRDRR